MKVKLAGVLVLVSVLTAAWLASHGYTTFATPYCNEGATNVTTGSQLLAAIHAGDDVCVTAAITSDFAIEDVEAETITGAGDLTQDSTTITGATGEFTAGMRIVGDGIARGARIASVDGATLEISPAATASASDVVLTGADDIQIGTSENGSLPFVDTDTLAWVTFHVRIRAIRLDTLDRVWVDNSIIGGTEDEPVDDQLVFLPSTSTDVLISNNDIGWTFADDTGTTGYGIRVAGDQDRLCICGNKVHDIAADGIQGFGSGEDILIDRNEIGPVAANPESDEHSDSIQLIDNGSNFRITNNWLHHQGYYHDEPTANSGTPYIHGTTFPSGEDPSLLIENNLVEHALGRAEICGLGTPSEDPYNRSNVTVRGNTFYDLGQSFPDFEGLEWDCRTGTGNVVERNIAVDPDGGFVNHGDADTFTNTSNLFGTQDLVTLDEGGNCTSTNCNPEGSDPIGYRKPSGVNW